MKNGKTTSTKTSTGSKKPNINKKSKSYQKWQENHEKGSKGIGDDIEKITKKTGIKKAVDYIFDKLGTDCGCDSRRDKINELFPHHKPECFTEDEYEFVKERIENNQNVFTAEETSKAIDIFMRIFRETKRPECTSCSFKGHVWQKLVNVYKTYL